MHFPGNKSEPIYVSMTEVISKEDIIWQQEEEKAFQLEWDARHPLEVAEREHQAAIDSLESEKKNIVSLQNESAKLKNTKEALVFTDAKRNPISIEGRACT